MKKLSAWLFLLIGVIWASTLVPGLRLGIIGQVVATLALIIIGLTEIKAGK